MIYIDEINFTKRSILLRDWSRKNSNLAVDQKDIYVGYRSVIASMTEENGFGSVIIHAQAINSDDFVRFLKKLRAKYPNRALALFMDRLNVRKSRDVKPWYDKLNPKTPKPHGADILN